MGAHVWIMLLGMRAHISPPALLLADKEAERGMMSSIQPFYRPGSQQSENKGGLGFLQEQGDGFCGGGGGSRDKQRGEAERKPCATADEDLW